MAVGVIASTAVRQMVRGMVRRGNKSRLREVCSHVCGDDPLPPSLHEALSSWLKTSSGTFSSISIADPMTQLLPPQQFPVLSTMLSLLSSVAAAYLLMNRSIYIKT